MGLMRALISLFLCMATAPSFAQDTPPLLLFLAPSGDDLQARLDAYDSVIVGACEDRVWGEAENLDGSQAIEAFIDQGLLPANTTRQFSTVVASGCNQPPRQHRYETLFIGGGATSLNYVGFAGQTRVQPLYLFDFRDQIAMTAGILAERNEGCSSEQSLSVMAVTGTRVEGSVSLETYLQARGPSAPAMPPIEAWREFWTVEYCPNTRADVPVLVADHGAGGLGLVISIDPED